MIAAAYDIAITDGVNEKGVAVNMLWLTESVYPDLSDSRPTLSVALWAQYLLDNFASVGEAVDALSGDKIAVVTDNLPGEDRLAMVHLSISDRSGDSAIFEYIEGKLVIHHGREYQVMTNSPTFEQQLAISEY